MRRCAAWLVWRKSETSLKAWNSLARPWASCVRMSSGWIRVLRAAAWEVRMYSERAVFVYTTYPSIVEAEQAGRALVERRLCACVNILPGMVSYYWWNGALERG